MTLPNPFKEAGNTNQDSCGFCFQRFPRESILVDNHVGNLHGTSGLACLLTSLQEDETLAFIRMFPWKSGVLFACPRSELSGNIWRSSNTGQPTSARPANP